MSERWPVIDTHFHIGSNPLVHCTESMLLDWMNKYEIDIQVIMQVNEGFLHHTPDWNPFIGNDFIANIQKNHPQRIIGLGRVNPWWQPPQKYLYGPRIGQSYDRVTRNIVLEELDRIVLDLGLWGLKMHPLEVHYQINNPRIINPIMARLTELQKKVNRRLFLFIHAAGDTLNNSPEAVADIARQFPDLLFIASHSGYKWAAPTVAHTMAALPNVMLDLTTMAAKACVAEAHHRYGASKFCTGSDGPFASVGVKNAIAQDVAANDEEYEMILGGNLAKVLGFPKVKK